MATFNRYATNQPAAPQRPGDDEDFRQLAAAHLAMPQQLQPPPGPPAPAAPSGNNAPPPGASSTPMTTAQMNDGGVDAEMHSIAARALGVSTGTAHHARSPQHADQGGGEPRLTGADAVGANVNVGTAPTYNAVNGGVAPNTMRGSMGQQVGSVDGKPIMSGNTPASVTALQGTTGPNGTRAANGMGGGFAAQQPKDPSAQAAAPSGAQSTQTTQQQQDQAQYDATQQQLEADKQRSLLDARARAGLGGMGLSGAASAQQGDITRTMDRTATQTLADLRTSQQANERANEDQKFKDEQRKAAVELLEQEGNFDADGDGTVAGMKVGGKIGDGNPDDFPGNAGPSSTASTPGVGADGNSLPSTLADAVAWLTGQPGVATSTKDNWAAAPTSNNADSSWKKDHEDTAFIYYRDASGNPHRVPKQQTPGSDAGSQVRASIAAQQVGG